MRNDGSKSYTAANVAGTDGRDALHGSASRILRSVLRQVFKKASRNGHRIP